MNFEIYPAIDLRNGKIVRLSQGDFSRETQYHFDIEYILEEFSQFASGIHIVNLDGALNGSISKETLGFLRQIRQKTDKVLQVGGGIREKEDISLLLEEGIERVIIGSKVVNKIFMNKIFGYFPKKSLSLGLDVRGKNLALKGWEQQTNISLENIIELYQGQIDRVIITDIERDGMLGGANTNLYKELKEQFPYETIIASGGIGSISDIKNIEALGIDGVILGKAWYEGKIKTVDLRKIKSA